MEKNQSSFILRLIIDKRLKFFIVWHVVIRRKKVNIFKIYTRSKNNYLLMIIKYLKKKKRVEKSCRNIDIMASALCT